MIRLQNSLTCFISILAEGEKENFFITLTSNGKYISEMLKRRVENLIWDLPRLRAKFATITKYPEVSEGRPFELRYTSRHLTSLLSPSQPMSLAHSSFPLAREETTQCRSKIAPRGENGKMCLLKCSLVYSRHRRPFGGRNYN